MRTKARAALAKRLDFLRGTVTATEQDALHERFARLGKERVRAYLFAAHGVGLDIAKATSNRALTQKLAEWGGDDRLLTLYGAVAWAARALVLAELLEQFDPDLPAKWAADATLRWLDDFEAEEVWLWPFESDHPWPEDDGEEF